MINVKGNKIYLTGKDEQRVKEEAKRLGLSAQDLVTGLLWEMFMRKAREGVFVKREKQVA